MTDKPDDRRQAPVVCTLTTKARSERRLTWAELAELALSQENVETGVVSTFPLALADQVEDLSRQELDCCGSWLTLSTERTADVIRLRATAATPEGVAVIRTIRAQRSEALDV